MNYILFLTIIVILLLYVYFLFFKKEQFQCFKSQLYHHTYDNNYNRLKDAGIMNDYDKNITFGKIEYSNLEERIINNEQESKSDEELIEQISKNLEYDASLESQDNYSIQKKELSIVQMDALLNLVLLANRYKNNLDLKLISEEPDLNKYSYDLVKDHLIFELSRQADSELFKNRFITTFNFKYFNDHIMSYKIDYDKNIEEYEIQMIVYRDKKDINYTVYCNLYFDNYNIKYYIKKIFIVGVNLRQRVNFDSIYNDSNKSFTKLDKLPNPSDKKIDSYTEDSEQFVKDEQMKRNQYKEDDRGYCFFKPNVQNKIQCESVDENGTGVWDKSCVYNEDCPYYKRNRNYPNSRGGCVNGYCEMPINLNRFGYKQINDNKLDDIICYNCKKESDSTCQGLNCNKCCEEQKDKLKYPTLISPDYAFEKDFNNRISNRSYFEKINVSPIKLIS
jgi:hypothetical protein